MREESLCIAEETKRAHPPSNDQRRERKQKEIKRQAESSVPGTQLNMLRTFCCLLLGEGEPRYFRSFCRLIIPDHLCSCLPSSKKPCRPPPPAFRTPPANIFIKLSATPLSTRALTLLRRKIFSGGRCLDQPERRERENHRKIYSPRRVFLFSIYSSVSLDGMGRSTGDDIAQWLKGREGYRLWGQQAGRWKGASSKFPDENFPRRLYGADSRDSAWKKGRRER